MYLSRPMTAVTMAPLKVCLLAVLPTAYADVEANPMNKVIGMLDDLKAKVQAEGAAEAKVYKEFLAWCGDAAKNKQFEIKTATAKKADLEATIEKSTSDISEGTTKIEELAAAISKSQAELKDATVIREKEQSEFSAAEAELVETVDALDRAIAIISREAQKNPAAFAQVDTSSVGNLAKSLGAILDAASLTIGDQKKLMALVQSQANDDGDDDDLSFGAPQAAGYKSKSGGIIDVLEDLKEKAESELADLRKAEQNAQHNYDMLKQSLDDQTAADTKDKDEETKAKEAAQETQATAEGDLSVTVKDLADAKAGLELANTDCMTVAADHETTVNARNEELEAIATATKILHETAQGMAFFLQVSSVNFNSAGSRLRTTADLKNAEIVNAVKRLAQEQHSAALAQLASRIDAVVRFGATAGEDPFAKIKSMVSDMISKLEKESANDATEKAYCDGEMAKTEAKKDELSDEVSKLDSKIDRASSASAKLKQEVKDIQQDLAALSKTQAEMDAIRAEEHENYMQAKSDLELGLSGVGKALGVLRDYYGGAAAMLQNNEFGEFMQQPAMPESHSKAGGAGSSIINMLEVVESDFSKNLAKEETQEADAVADYEKTTQANKVTKAMQEKDVEYKTKEFKHLDKSLTDLSSDKDTSSAELSAVLEYYEKLKGRCIAKPESYEERAKRREAEVAGLKDALKILEEESSFTQRSKRGVGAVFLSLAKAARH